MDWASAKEFHYLSFPVLFCLFPASSSHNTKQVAGIHSFKKLNKLCAIISGALRLAAATCNVDCSGSQVKVKWSLCSLPLRHVTSHHVNSTCCCWRWMKMDVCASALFWSQLALLHVREDCVSHTVPPLYSVAFLLLSDVLNSSPFSDVVRPFHEDH